MSYAHPCEPLPVMRQSGRCRLTFLPTCGFALNASMAEERRVVTVLFADLVGFTTLSEHLDPEQVSG